MRETAYLISVGMQWFVLIVGTGFMIALLNKWLLEPGHRPFLLQQIRKHWRWGIVLIILILCSVPAIFAETEIHHQDANGNVTVEVIRTPQEQQMAEYAYDMGNGVTGHFFDGKTPHGGVISKEEYLAQVHENNRRVIDARNNMLGEAKEFQDSGGMTQEEYFDLHSQIQVANGNTVQMESSIKQSIADARAKPDHLSTPQRQIKVVEKKVLVAG